MVFCVYLGATKIGGLWKGVKRASSYMRQKVTAAGRAVFRRHRSTSQEHLVPNEQIPHSQLPEVHDDRGRGEGGSGGIDNPLHEIVL